MEKSTFGQMGGTYRQEGDYLLPNLTVPESTPIGIWGQRRKRYLFEHRNPFYTALLFSGKLYAHLASIDHQAQEMFSQLIEQMATREEITEQLKEENQMEWVEKMNNIRNLAEEMVFCELIFN